MTKRIILPVLIIIALAGLYVYKHRESPRLDIPQTEEAKRDEAWAVFEKYIGYAKDHDIEGLKTVAYKLSAACNDPGQKEECFSRMDTVSSFGQDVHISDLPHTVSDGRQIILYTDFNEHLDGDSPSITRGVLYFARAADGTLRFVSIEPFQGSVLVRSGFPFGTATSTFSTKLRELVKDSDNDMIPDITELCQDETAPVRCIKTNPNKKDTDDDGWWDSIEQYI